ncbi:MAG: hypothetical protein HYW48_08975 [Deltaproteobacteria bacterium]|nr:hypothetical protein [Deltaproteobacteria bacterium]
MKEQELYTKHELHLHLYGCLDADDVWQLGRKAWRERTDGLEWYADEYEKVWGRRPDWKSYWEKEDGRERLRRDYLFQTPSTLDHFLACINLSIAMFPITPDNVEVLDHILHRMKHSGLRYAELRNPLPTRFGEDETRRYLSTFAKSVLTFEMKHGASFIPRIPISLSREDEDLYRLYGYLRRWLDGNPELAAAIPAIDFCHAEEGFPPKHKKEFFKRVQEDNAKSPRTALAILYHVGESFQTISIESSARWVWQTHTWGAHRLGHCISLGVPPQLMVGKSVRERVEERLDHISFLLENKSWLRKNGYIVDETEILKEREALRRRSPDERLDRTYTEDDVPRIRAFQDALMDDLREKKAMIECNPSSNLLIGNIPSPEFHPLRRFLAKGLNVSISTDDPGLFNTSMQKEEQLCSEKMGLSVEDLRRLAKNAELATASQLVRRKL